LVFSTASLGVGRFRFHFQPLRHFFHRARRHRPPCNSARGWGACLHRRPPERIQRLSRAIQIPTFRSLVGRW